MLTKVCARNLLTDNIATFSFKQLFIDEAKRKNNFRGWYDDLGMVAKHFTVSSTRLPHIRRQYTICQTMEFSRLQALVNLADDIL